MTWKELKEKSKKLGYRVVMKIEYDREVECLVNTKNNYYGFYRNGFCEIKCHADDNLCGTPFAFERTPAQMYAIMEALDD